MITTRQLFSILFLAFGYLWSAPTYGDFNHPGIAHSQKSIEFVISKLAEKQQPWTDAWNRLKQSRYSSLDWKPKPWANVERGSYGNPDIGSSEFSRDSRAAYNHALCWTITGKEAHAKKAAEILNAWSNTLRSVGNHDAKLLIGMSGHGFVVSAEIIKHTWDKWPEKEQAKFEAMLKNIWYPIIQDFFPSANGNWDASMMQVMIAMGVFLDDQKMFDRAVEYYKNGNGNGAIGNYFKESGQCQESGRDQAHTQMGLEFLANTAETAWIQGIDLYGELNNRLLKGFEYTAKYNLGFDVPYVPYKSFDGRYHYKRISDDSRGRLRPMYERVFNHYHNRLGIEAPYTNQAAIKLRDAQAGSSQSSRHRRVKRARNHSPKSSHLDILMYADQPRDLPAKQSVELDMPETK